MDGAGRRDEGGSGMQGLAEGVQLVGLHGLVDEEQEPGDDTQQQQLQPHRQEAQLQPPATGGRRRGVGERSVALAVVAAAALRELAALQERLVQPEIALLHGTACCPSDRPPTGSTERERMKKGEAELESYE